MNQRLLKQASLLILAIMVVIIPAQAQNLVVGGNMEDESAWNVLYYNADSQPEYEFNFTGDSLRFGQGGSLDILQGETGGQLLLWQRIKLIAGKTYRATGAISTLDFAYGDGGGSWYQMYISTEIPDETASDFNPLEDTFFDVGWGWDRDSEFFDGLWEDENLGAGVASAPYYTAPGTPGEEVEVTFGIKFGQYYPDYAGLGFELLVDEVGLYPVDSAVNQGGNMEDENAWDVLYYNADSQPEYEFNFTGDSLRFGQGGSLDILQGETGGQLLLWQTLHLVGGETYRATGAISTLDFAYGDGGGSWYQMYISTEVPDETASDFNPLDDKFFDVGWGWDRDSEFFDGLWEVENLGAGVASAPYYTAPGTPGEDVEVTFGIKFGQYYPDYAGLGFELLVDEVYLFPMGEGGATSVADKKPLSGPSSYALYSNFPNPFNPETTIEYAIPASSTVHLTVFDMLGKQVASLVNEKQVAGTYSVQFDASNLPSGIYFYTLNAGNQNFTKKLTVLK